MKFTVQKHDATNLHYDFRLEIGGVLKSWAIPKGPSTDPEDKRLAIPTSDHKLSYADFEGEIEEGYGKGKVLLWDRGEYKNKTQEDGEKIEVEEAYDNGFIEFELKGEKLKGDWAIKRFKKDKWLLIKQKDKHANDKTNEKSVKSGKTLNQIG